jgi:hypothetical protein
VGGRFLGKSTVAAGFFRGMMWRKQQGGRFTFLKRLIKFNNFKAFSLPRVRRLMTNHKLENNKQKSAICIVRDEKQLSKFVVFFRAVIKNSFLYLRNGAVFQPIGGKKLTNLSICKSVFSYIWQRKYCVCVFCADLHSWEMRCSKWR